MPMRPEEISEVAMQWNYYSRKH